VMSNISLTLILPEKKGKGDPSHRTRRSQKEGEPSSLLQPPAFDDLAEKRKRGEKMEVAITSPSTLNYSFQHFREEERHAVSLGIKRKREEKGYRGPFCQEGKRKGGSVCDDPRAERVSQEEELPPNEKKPEGAESSCKASFYTGGRGGVAAEIDTATKSEECSGSSARKGGGRRLRPSTATSCSPTVHHGGRSSRLGLNALPLV